MFGSWNDFKDKKVRMKTTLMLAINYIHIPWKFRQPVELDIAHTEVETGCAS